MKRILGLTFFLGLAATAAPLPIEVVPRYDIRLASVSVVPRANPAKKRMIRDNPTPTITAYGEAHNLFDDGFVIIECEIWPANVLLAVTNKGTAPIKIRWNEASLIDTNGEAHAVFHETAGGADERTRQQIAEFDTSIKKGDTRTLLDQLRAANREPSAASSPSSPILISGAKDREYVYPIDFISPRGRKALLAKGEDWTEFAKASLDATVAGVQERASVLVGKSFILSLPIESGDSVIDYVATFEIRGVQVVKR